MAIGAYHLVVETPDANLTRGMRQLNGVYTQQFNRMHGRVGHVFQENQVYLGSDGFLEKMLEVLEGDKELSEIPKSQRRSRPLSLAGYESKAGTRDEAIVMAYRSGGYTQKEIGAHFGLHYARVSRIISKAKGKT